MKRLPPDPSIPPTVGIGREHPNGWDHAVKLTPEHKAGDTVTCCCGKTVTLQGYHWGVQPWHTARHPDANCAVAAPL